MRKMAQLTLLALTSMTLAACTTTSEASNDAGSVMSEVDLRFDMVDSFGDTAGYGIVQETAEGVVLHLELEGLPQGEYGMHIHENGAATFPDFEDAGGHLNPTDVEHGIDSETGPHLGDLPNLIVPANGIVSTSIEIPGATLDPRGEKTLQGETGSSLIIHEQADDYSSQPSGDAGARMVGGVIENNW